MPKNETIEYEWCQYSNDVIDGLYTVRQIIKKDFAKVFSQGEAQALIAKLEDKS